MKEVNKNIGENIQKCWPISYSHNKNITYSTNRAKFVRALKNHGYTIETKGVGNYIVATKDNESNVFYFTSHASNLHNYLLPVTLKYNTNYFAFYDNVKNCVYIVSYGKVREYCKNITKAFIFNNYKPTMFIPDSWAHQQVINTYKI